MLVGGFSQGEVSGGEAEVTVLHVPFFYSHKNGWFYLRDRMFDIHGTLKG